MVRKGFIVFLNEEVKRQSCLLHSHSNITVNNICNGISVDYPRRI